MENIERSIGLLQQNQGLKSWRKQKPIRAFQVPSGFYQEVKEPSTYTQDSLLARQTRNLLNEVKELKKILQEQNDKYEIIANKIYSLPSEEWQLKGPLDIIIKITMDEVIALIPELELYGEGRNEFEAVSELKNELLDLIDDLYEVPETELGRDPKSWKKVLNLLVEKCQ